MSKIIGDFEIIDHGIEHSQYFQGCGTVFTPFTECATGIGDNFAQAIEDALDFIAQGDDYDTDGMDARILEYLNAESLPTSPSVDQEDYHWQDDDDCELYYYVSIRYREASLWEVIVGNIGAVYSGNDEALARTTYNYYCNLAGEDNSGRVEYPVTLLQDGEAIDETAQVS